MLRHLLYVLNLSLLSCAANVPSFGSWPHGRITTLAGSIAFRYYGSGPPVLLVHGNPQYSLTWQFVAPLLASHGYTVICPDNRGAGDSSIPVTGNYSAAASSEDLHALMAFLHINQTYVFSHDKGAGMATALAIQHPSLVARLGLSEYPLPGFGYETSWTPTYDWNLYSNWQLAFFSVVDAAEFFIAGREQDMLAWYFFHGSYSGNEAISHATLERYASSISKPGFLRAMLQPFAAAVIGEDAAFFNRTLAQSRLQMPVMVLGGEASLAPAALIRQLFDPVAGDLTADIIPKAGHWIADENPEWLARRVVQFLKEDPGIPAVDLSWLEDTYTLLGQSQS